MKKLYMLEEVIREIAEHEITGFYVELIAHNMDISVKEALELLMEFYKKRPDKISLHYQVLCPKCKERIFTYSDFLSIEMSKYLTCTTCGDFKVDTTNIYIFFKVTDEWLKNIRASNETKKEKEEKKRLSKIKSEENLINWLEMSLNIFNNIPDGEISTEGKIIHSQIKTYLESKKLK